MRSLTRLDLTFNQLDGRCALLPAHKMLARVAWMRACMQAAMWSCTAEFPDRHSPPNFVVKCQLDTMSKQIRATL